ncbi:zf-TFIIB domain-containing protein [candidate division WOR-3 bacterium]|nr:zf-TFIIB domain-containing protein [candidate division WOR-3 bacterium]
MDKIKCPVCNKNLKTITYENQEVDFCQTCGGVWFDKGELMGVVDGLLSKDLVDSESVEEAYRKKAVSSKDIDIFQRCCPRCKVRLEVFNFSYDSNVFLDRCPSCLGIWADKDEWVAIAKYIKGNPEVDKLAEALASEFKEPLKLIGNISRVAAVIVSLFYLVAASVMIGLEGFLRVLMILVLPLACIFFGEHMGKVTGTWFGISLARPIITKPTPGFVLAIGGWLVLLTPLFAYIAQILAEM